MARRSTGNISAVKRGTEQARPSMDRTLRCAASGHVEDAHCGRGGCLILLLSVLTSFSRTRTRYRTRTGGPSSVIRCGFVAFSVGAICGGFHKSQSEHAVGQLGCMAWIMVGSARIQFNGSSGGPSPPSRAVRALRVLMLVLGMTCRHSQVLTTGSALLTCSAVVQQ